MVLTLTSIVPASDPTTVYEAKTASSNAYHLVEASLAPAVDAGAPGVRERTASAGVALPSAGGQHGNGYRVDAQVDREPRKITIRRQEEVRVGDVLILKYEGEAEVYCDSSIREKLCDLYDQLPDAPED